MRTIWKFRLSTMGVTRIEMPRGSWPVHVAFQDDLLMLWAIVDPAAPLSAREFVVLGTGREIPPGHWEDYIGTAHWENLVWHVFGDSS